MKGRPFNRIHTDFALSVLDVELEDALDLLDLLLAVSFGEPLELSLDSDEDGGGLETIDSDISYWQTQWDDNGQ